MQRVKRVFALIVAGCLSLAMSGVIAGAGANSPPPEGPALAFSALGTLSASGFTVNTLGLEASRSHVAVRGSRHGVVPSPNSGLTWSADGSKLAFTGSRGGRSGVYTANADGSGARFLRGTKGGSGPVFSPDGSKIAFAREGTGLGLLFASTPWVANVDGSGARRLIGWHRYVTFTPTSFSPDGSTLAVTRSEFASDEPKILLFRLNRKGVRSLVERASEPEFSPDGSRIVFVKHSLERQGKLTVTHKDLFIAGSDGKGLKRLTRTPWVAETHPSWDPSGERIAFNSFRISRDPFERLFDELLPEGNSIVQVNADGTCREKLYSQHLLGIYGAHWRPGPGREAGRIECGAEGPPAHAPDGPRLAVVKFSLPEFRFELETVDETGAQPLRIAGGGEGTRPLPEWFTAPSWSPDGSTIVFAAVGRRLFGGPRETRLYVSRADGSRLRPLRGTHGADQPVFTPDGTAVAFTRVRFRAHRGRDGKEKPVPRGSSIWLVKLAGGHPERITPARKGLYLYGKSFSPDGGTLLGSRSVGRRWEAVEIDMATRKIGVLLHNAEDPVYSPDGSRIVFARWRARKHPDGSVAESADLFTVNAGGGGLRRLTSSPGSDLFPSWDPSGQRIAFVHYRPEVTELDEIGMGSSLLQINADGSCPSAILRPARKVALYGAAWQPGTGREVGPIKC
jgi:Tol biopolymer transport system component